MEIAFNPPSHARHNKKEKQYMNKLYWFIHHRQLLELRTCPIRVRIAFINKNKDPRERPVRLRALKPVKRPDLLPQRIRSLLRQISRSQEKGYYLDAVHIRQKLEHLLAVGLRKSEQLAIVRRHKREYPKAPCRYWSHWGKGRFVANRLHSKNKVRGSRFDPRLSFDT